MNISHKELADLYGSYLRSRTPSSREACPEAGALWKLFDSRTRERTKSRLLDHVGRCSRCADDFLAVLEIRRATGDFEAGIERLRSPDIPRPERRREGGWKRWQFACLTAGSFILAAALLVFLRLGPFSGRPPEEARARARTGIELVNPAQGAAVSKNELFFQWTAGGRVEAYVLELFDASLARIWKSATLESPRVAPPPGVRGSLRAGESYSWMVTGYDFNGRAIESDLRGFRIRD